MKIRLQSFVAVMLLSIGFAMAQGLGHAIHFDGEDNYIQLSNPLTVGSSSHTFELWVRVPLSGTEGLTSGERVGNILGAYNSTPHFNYEIYSNGAPRVYWNGGEVNSTAPSSADLRDGKWHHLAFVRDTTNSEFRVFIDGVVVNTIPSSGTNLAMVTTHRIGGDNRNGDGGPTFHGDMAEIRLWDYARSEAEIRQAMCMKVDTASPGLLHYYNMTAGSGSTVADRGSAGNTGTMINFAAGTKSWVPSGAAIGDTSVYVYPSSFAGQSLSLGSMAKGTLLIDSIQNSAEGLHLYRMNSLPSSIAGIKDIASNDTYFGVYVAGDSSMEYNMRFQYGGFPLAVSNEDSLLLFHREGADSTNWSDISATRLLTNNELKKSLMSGYRGEFILGNFVGFICNAPSALNATSVSYSSARLEWTSGGAVIWDITYDTTGFDPEHGNIITAASSNPYTLTGLKPLTSYEYYVRDNCGTQGSSSWVGPFPFTTTAAPACDDPFNLSVSEVTYFSAEVSFNSISGSTNIEYGPAGFSRGSGTFIAAVNSPYVISDLAASTDYDIYIQDSCNMVNASSWVGPVSFTTEVAVLPNTPVSMKFDGIDDYIELTTPLTIGNSAHTFELWVKVPKIGTDNLEMGERVGVLIGTYSVAGNYNYEIYGNGAPRIWWNEGAINSTASMDYDLRDNQWHHLAFVRDTAGNQFRMYIDGEQVHTINTKGDDIAVNVPHRIGGDHRANDGGPSFHGQMDEIRIWNIAKTETQIREDMCRTVDPSAAGLLHYYDLDSLNFKDKTEHNNDGSLFNFNFPGWANSGAPLGDTSVYVHASSLSGVSLALSSAAKGEVRLDSLSGSLHGMHLYRLDRIPNSVEGVYDLSDQDVYFGTFISENFKNSKPNKYNLFYDYSGYPNAVSNEADLNLYVRSSGAASMWTNSGAVGDASTDEVRLQDVSVGKQYLLADFSPAPCEGSHSLGVQNVKIDSVELTWSAPALSPRDIEYGPMGFEPGSGIIEEDAMSPLLITDLAGLTAYEFYVKDSCAVTGSVSWVGPYTFLTLEPCPAPDFSLRSVTDSSASFDVIVNGRDTNWVFIWGPVGFNIDFGIETKATGNPAVLHGLQPSTSYDVYIKADCDSMSSNWVGPIQIETDSTQSSNVGLTEEGVDGLIKLYPNPAKDVFTIEAGADESARYMVYDLSGRLMDKGEFTGKKEVNIPSSMGTGIYLVRVYSEKASALRKLIIRR